MIVKTLVDITKEIEVNVSLDDVMAILKDSEEIERLYGKIGAVNIAFGLIKRTTDSMINAMTKEQRQIIHKALLEQAQRFSRSS